MQSQLSDKSKDLYHFRGATAGRKLLFLHIPKTAGTSFISLLGGIFGESNLFRFSGIRSDFAANPEAFVQRWRAQLDSCSVMVGHIPFPYWAPILPKCHSFTILRNPIDRVISLYRFLQTRPSSELEALGLKDKFCVEEMLESSEPDLARQINNGMCRFIGSRIVDNKLVEPEGLELLDQALRNLSELDVGFVEDLVPTLAEWSIKWGIPGDPKLPRENVTRQNPSFISPTAMISIAQLNTLDFALYHTAKQRHLARAPVGHISPRREINLLTCLRVANGTYASAGAMPGKFGFHPVEDDSLAWVREECRRGEFVVLSDETKASILLGIYCDKRGYPIESVRFFVNDRKMKPEISLREPNHFDVVLRDQHLNAGLNRIAIEPSIFSPPNPRSADRRALAIAFTHLTVT